MQELPIDYSLLSRAIDFYASRGYTMINVPWMVYPKYSRVTLTHDEGAFVTTNIHGDELHLVGSAEQGFIQQAHMVAPGKKYMSVTPCFRRGDISMTHMEWFMKLELSSCAAEPDEMYLEFLDDAWSCFVELGANQDKMRDKVERGFADEFHRDINYNHRMNECDMDLELGSYGHRIIPKVETIQGVVTGSLHSENHVINYGTGLALPRFQLILK